MGAPLIDVSSADLDDLRSRLRNTRWADVWPDVDWEAGTSQRALRSLVDYWATDYDWRSHEAAINALPSHFATIDGTPVHFLRFDAETASDAAADSGSDSARVDALPLILTHGWPSTFLELTGLADRLANPSRYGGDPADAFTVIVPSLPGFGFSPQRTSLLNAMPTHEIWHRLMHDELGFERYGAHGGDLGAGVSARLGEAHPESVVGIHVLAVAGPAPSASLNLTEEEVAYLESVETWERDEGAYEHQHHTRPLTLAPGLSDSPVGLLSWLVEKYRAWTDSHGVLSTRMSDDFVLTQVSLYWFTNTIGTSLRPYFEYGRSSTSRVERVTVPTAVAVFPADLSQPPRSWAERTYNVTRYERMPRGGHFAAHEEPQLLATDITEFFRDLR